MKIDRKSSYLLNNFRNFNEVFRKDLTYDNIESPKKPGRHHPLSRRYIFGKITEGTSPRAVQGLIQRFTWF